jgi:hypothetical protein
MSGLNIFVTLIVKHLYLLKVDGDIKMKGKGNLIKSVFIVSNCKLYCLGKGILCFCIYSIRLRTKFFTIWDHGISTEKMLCFTVH